MPSKTKVIHQKKKKQLKNSCVADLFTRQVGAASDGELHQKQQKIANYGEQPTSTKAFAPPRCRVFIPSFSEFADFYCHRSAKSTKLQHTLTERFRDNYTAGEKDCEFDQHL